MEELHHRIIRLSLESIGRDHGFALAGGYAVQAHHIVDRPSQDVDLFTSWDRREELAAALEQLQGVLRASGLAVEIEQQYPAFARLIVTDLKSGDATTVDLAANIRLKPPVHLTVGPVLDRDDLAAGKTECLFTRAESRDFIDVHALATGGHYTAEQLLGLAASRDAGFDRAVFAEMLGAIRRFSDDEFRRYGLNDEQIGSMRAFYDRWKATLTAQGGREQPDLDKGRTTQPTSPATTRKRTRPDYGREM